MAEKLKVCGSCGKTIPFNSDCECRKDIRNSRGKYREDNKDLMTYRWNQKVRPMIIKRDNGHCQRCLIKFNVLNSSDITVHHIKSRLNYPELTWEEDNLITLCMSCNNQLGTSDKLDFKWKIKEIQYYL